MNPESVSLATWIMILSFILLGISFFVRPLWPMKFTFLWIGLGNKILMGHEKLPTNIEKQKQELLDENSDRYKQMIVMARLFGIWCFLIVAIYFWLNRIYE